MGPSRRQRAGLPGLPGKYTRHYRTFLKVAQREHPVTTPPVPYSCAQRTGSKTSTTWRRAARMTPEQALEWLEAEVARERARRKAMGYAE